MRLRNLIVFFRSHTSLVQGMYQSPFTPTLEKLTPHSQHLLL